MLFKDVVVSFSFAVHSLAPAPNHLVGFWMESFWCRLHLSCPGAPRAARVGGAAVAVAASDLDSLCCFNHVHKSKSCQVLAGADGVGGGGGSTFGTNWQSAR